MATCAGVVMERVEELIKTNLDSGIIIDTIAMSPYLVKLQ